MVFFPRVRDFYQGDTCPVDRSRRPDRIKSRFLGLSPWDAGPGSSAMSREIVARRVVTGTGKTQSAPFSSTGRDKLEKQ